MINHYTHKDLIGLYLSVQKDSYKHPDLREYDRQLYSHLSTLFEISITREGVRNTRYMALWLLFAAAVRSGINTPYFGESFLDTSLLFKKLEDLGERGSAIEGSMMAVNQKVQECQQLYRKIIDDLFDVLYEPDGRIITSAQLLERGFDDRKKPQEHDYNDLL